MTACYQCGKTAEDYAHVVGWVDSKGERVGVCFDCIKRTCEEVYDEHHGVKLTAENVRRRNERLGIGDARKDE